MNSPSGSEELDDGGSSETVSLHLFPDLKEAAGALNGKLVRSFRALLRESAVQGEASLQPRPTLAWLPRAHPLPSPHSQGHNHNTSAEHTSSSPALLLGDQTWTSSCVGFIKSGCLGDFLACTYASEILTSQCSY